MSLRRQEGEFDFLYVAASKPTDRETTAGYTKVGLLSDLDSSVSNDAQSALDRASSQHESVIYGQQSSVVNGTVNVKKEEGGTTAEDAGQVLLRDAAVDQDNIFYLIMPKDEDGNNISGLEAEYGSFVVEDFSRTANSGEFKQYDFSGAGREQPSFFTVP